MASKHAIIGLTKSAALEAAAYGVRVNAIGPGSVQTAMFDRITGYDDSAKVAFLGTVPIGRARRPEEMFEAVACATSPSTGFLTGRLDDLRRRRHDGGLSSSAAVVPRSLPRT